MGQRKQPSPLSAPIARLRAAGVTVTYTDNHHPSNHALTPTIGLRVTRPGLLPLIIERPGHAYADVVDRLNRLAADIENNRPAY